MSVTGTLTGGTFDDFLTAYIIAQFRTTGSQQTVQEAVSLNFTKIEYRNISLVNDNVRQWDSIVILLPSYHTHSHN